MVLLSPSPIAHLRARRGAGGPLRLMANSPLAHPRMTVQRWVPPRMFRCLAREVRGQQPPPAGFYPGGAAFTSLGADPRWRDVFHRLTG